MLLMLWYAGNARVQASLGCWVGARTFCDWQFLMPVSCFQFHADLHPLPSAPPQPPAMCPTTSAPAQMQQRQLRECSVCMAPADLLVICGPCLLWFLPHTLRTNWRVGLLKYSESVCRRLLPTSSPQVFIPCGHRAVCADCSKQLLDAKGAGRACPICRAHVSRSVVLAKALVCMRGDACGALPAALSASTPQTHVLLQPSSACRLHVTQVASSIRVFDS